MSHQFDPNAAASSESGIFGLPYSLDESTLVFLPVPWEATTSYGGGTSEGPRAIIDASRQVDLFDTDVVKPYLAGLYILPESEEVRKLNIIAKASAQKIIEVGGNIDESDQKLKASLAQVNEASEKLNTYVYEETKKIIQLGKLVGVVGGDHSVPFGAIQAIAEKHSSFGILHFDAHSDTRDAYEGFTWSHASIMRNVLDRIPQVSQLTQVGIRDLCEEEIEYVNQRPNRAKAFYDRDLARKKFEGSTWSQICNEIIATLPEHVWVSFDIDGLDPRYCPHTGTPVPGGLDFQEANYLIGVLVRSGKKIIGFDLNEVAPNLSDSEDEWDANVGARLLYKLTGYTLASQGKCKLLP